MRRIELALLTGGILMAATAGALLSGKAHAQHTTTPYIERSLLENQMFNLQIQQYQLEGQARKLEDQTERYYEALNDANCKAKNNEPYSCRPRMAGRYKFCGTAHDDAKKYPDHAKEIMDAYDKFCH